MNFFKSLLFFLLSSSPIVIAMDRLSPNVDPRTDHVARLVSQDLIFRNGVPVSVLDQMTHDQTSYFSIGQLKDVNGLLRFFIDDAAFFNIQDGLKNFHTKSDHEKSLDLMFLFNLFSTTKVYDYPFVGGQLKKKIGNEINVRDPQTQLTQLHREANKETGTCINLREIYLLIAAGADLDCGDKDSRTPLRYAALSGNIPCIHALVKAGALVNKADRFKVTPLMEAVAYEEEESVKTLLEAGADIHLKNTNGLTAYDLALRLISEPALKAYQAKKIVQLLKEKMIEQ